MPTEIRDLPVREKVVAYIVHDGRLLVFDHVDDPAAGVQVPAGTIEPGESPAEAVMREAVEETGLQVLRLVAFLGVVDRVFERDDERHHHRRHYFHLVADGPVAERWRHWERTPSGDGSEPILFECYWLPCRQPWPDLSGDLGVCLPRLALASD